MAVALLGIAQFAPAFALSFLAERQNVKRLGERRQGAHVNRLFTGFGQEEFAGDGHVITKINKAKDFPG